MSEPLLPRVVLVEDDPAFRLFVSMALETFAIDLVVCASVQEARVALGTPARLLLCDLNLPGESGRVLLEEQAACPTAPRTLVFSGGLDDSVRLHLAKLGVWRAVAKPCGLAELEAAVQEALEHTGDGNNLQQPRAAPVGPRADDDRSAAVQEHFAGDQALYAEYAAFCRAQFRQDLRCGEEAMRARDLTALRHLGHSLKTVLRSLGYPAPSEVAARLESSAHAGDHTQAEREWLALAAALGGLADEA